MSPFELDRHVHRDLRRLPPPAAPADFKARVLAARARFDARPWYRKAWVVWPLEWQLASGAALASLVVLLGAASPWAYAFVSDLAVRLVTEHAPSLRAAFVAVETVWESIVRPVALLFLPVVLLMWAALAACGVALTRIASGEVSRS
jgi:hypothetical protein